MAEKKAKVKEKTENVNTATTESLNVEVAFVCTSDFVDVANAVNIPKG